MAQLPIPYAVGNDISNAVAWQRVQDNFTDLYAIQSRTVNAGDVRFAAGATTEARIQMAIDQAVIELASRVYVPAFMLPYDASLVTFNTAIAMVREGGAFDVADVKAYGAAGDSTTDDTASFIAAIAWAAAAQGRVVIPSNAGLRYIVNQSLTLYPNIMIQGQSAGISTPIIRFTGTTATFLQFVGTTEAQPLTVALRDFQVENANAGTNIGLRLRNFSDCTLSGVNFNHFRVGVWADWGQNLYITSDCHFVLNTRGIQLGGNLTQTETPAVAAGIRGGPATPYTDMVTIRDCEFSQNEIDINDMGSITSLGILVVDGCRFYESASSPVAGKAKFITITQRKSFRMVGSFIESPNASRVGVLVSLYNYEGTFSGANYGFVLEGNEFLFTGSSTDCIYVECGGGLIQGNVLENANSATARHISLMDSTSLRSTTVGHNIYLQYPDFEIAPKIRVSGGAMHNIVRSSAPFIKALTYSASMAVDPAAADTFTVTATNGTAFAFVITTANLRVGYLTIEIQNSAGGALGVATFTGCTLTGGAWTQPASTFKRSITFFNNGTSYVEMSRAANDY